MQFRRSALLLCLVGPLVAQTTLTVPGQFPTIQAAINAAVSGNTVLVAPGSYAGAIDFLGKGILVQSSGGAGLTSITGTSAARVVRFATSEGPAATLDGFTIAGGAGGILCQNASPTIRDCIVTGNVASADEGGGLRIRAVGSAVCSPTITSCVFHDNFTFYSGGGAFIATTTSSSIASPSFTDCAFESNVALSNVLTAVAGGGGGVAVHGNTPAPGTLTPSFLRCRFQDNACTGNGAGLQVAFSTGASFTSCELTDNVNSSSNGGGIAVETATAAFKGCVIARNVGGGLGSGVIGVGSGGALTFRHCTIAANAGWGGVYLSTIVPGPSASFANCILWGNAGIDVLVTGFTPSITYCDVGGGSGATGVGNLSGDPLFLDPSYDFHLAPNSPCRDAGDAAAGSAPPTDMDGGPRIAGPATDMGADEIPLSIFPGTDEALAFYAWIDGTGDPLESVRPAAAGSIATFQLASPGGALIGTPPLIAAQFFPDALPPTAPLLPGLWLDAGLVIVYGGFPSSAFSFGLPAAGVTGAWNVPPGLQGLRLRVQGFVSTPFAANGLFASANAIELDF
jgi:hypothetical protein